MENNKEIERMNELAFGKKKAKVSPSKEKQNLNESVVGVGAINSPFLQREKTDYELAFEHYMNEEANKDNTLIEELKAENELLKEVIKEKLTEAEIEEIFGKFFKKKTPVEKMLKKMSPEDAMAKGKSIAEKSRAKRGYYSTINKKLGGEAAKKYLMFVGYFPEVKYPKFVKDEESPDGTLGFFVDGTKYGETEFNP